MRTRFFVTVWLKAEDSEEVPAFSRAIRRAADSVDVELGELKVSPSGRRITIYGILFGSAPEEELERFTSAVLKATRRKAKGRILK